MKLSRTIVQPANLVDEALVARAEAACGDNNLVIATGVPKDLQDCLAGALGNVGRADRIARQRGQLPDITTGRRNPGMHQNMPPHMQQIPEVVSMHNAYHQGEGREWGYLGRHDY